VPPLVDVQAGVRQALLTGEAAPLAPLLVGGGDGRKRLAIHQRQYRASLVSALLGRFPATVWLVGSELVRTAALQFIERHPPTRPCIAEYGEPFPAFLMSQPRAGNVPYLGDFAELEWHLGRLSLGADGPALRHDDLTALDLGSLSDARVALQPGIQLLHVQWAVDELMSLYLADRAPDRFSLTPGDLWLELRGCRGELQMTRLSRATFLFRSSLAGGQSLGDAALSALDVEPGFDAGRALLDLLDQRAIATIAAPRAEGAS